MDLTNEQLKLFCCNILVSDIKEYINSHRDKYQEFLKNREKQK